MTLVARRDYLRTVRRRGFVAGTLLLPLAMGLIFAHLGVRLDVRSAAARRDRSSSSTSQRVPIVADARLTPHVVVVDRAEADRRLADAHRSPTTSSCLATWPAANRSSGGHARPTRRRDSPSSRSRSRLARAERDGRVAAHLAHSRGGRARLGARPSSSRRRTTRTSGANGGESSDAAILSTYLVPYAFTLDLHAQHLHHQRLPAPVGHRGEGEPRRRDPVELDPGTAVDGGQGPRARRGRPYPGRDLGRDGARGTAAAQQPVLARRSRSRR